MKIKKECPKCNSQEILRIDGTWGAYADNSISTGYLSAVPVNRYVCCTCGFTEEWIDREDIYDLQRKYG